MKREEALKQINEIKEIIESENKVKLPKMEFVIFGIFFMISPFIIHLTTGFTFGISKLQNNLYVGIVTSLYFIVFTFFIIPKLAVYLRKNNKETFYKTHPLIKKVLELERPVVFSMIGVIAALVIINKPIFIFSFVLIFWGMFFYLLGVLSNDKVIRIISWSDIIVGCILIVVTYYTYSNFVFYFSSFYFGLAFLVMGLRNSK
jgi:hypothetical protein